MGSQFISNNNPNPLFETSSKYTESPQVTNEVYTAKKKAQRVVDRFKLPEGFSISHKGTGITNTGQIGSEVFTSAMHDEATGPVGSIQWSPRTGDIKGFYMDEGVRPYASHLLNAAHDYAAQEGVDGPTYSTEMTDYSYNMAKRLVPSSIPQRALAGGAPVQFRDESFLRKVHELKSEAHLLEAKGGQLHPGLARLSISERPSAHLGAALEAHDTGFHSEMGNHFENAKEAILDLTDRVIDVDHPDANALKDSWHGVLDKMDESRMRY